jgi:two-component system, NarL family, nitrate/nitrite response regulator NarP
MTSGHSTPTAIPRPGSIRVAIVDSRRLVGDALAALIRTMDGFAVIDVFEGAKALPAIVARDPTVLIVGVGADLTAAFDFVRSLRHITLTIEIVILADRLSPDLVKFVLDQRLNGLILTDTSPSDLAACLGRVARGHAVLPRDWQRILDAHGDDPVGSLSDRQLEVLRLVAEGYSYDEIGARLFISANTVKFHLRSIYLRLGVRNRVAAARMLAERRGA